MKLKKKQNKKTTMINEQLKRLVNEKLQNTSDVLQPINACITRVIEFNVITTCTMIFFKINTQIL